MDQFEYYPLLDAHEVEKYFAKYPEMRRLADDAAERQRLMTDKDRRKSIVTLVRDTVNADD